jgi:hypothetical protein
MASGDMKTLPQEAKVPGVTIEVQACAHNYFPCVHVVSVDHSPPARLNGRQIAALFGQHHQSVPPHFARYIGMPGPITSAVLQFGQMELDCSLVAHQRITDMILAMDAAAASPSTSKTTNADKIKPTM